MIEGIHHVAIICNNYAASKRFYSEVLGCEIIAEHYRADRESFKLDLRLQDNTQIELFSFPNRPERPSYPEARGLRHLAFRVKELEPFIDHLQQLGIDVEPIRIDPYTKQRFTFFADPDNLPLELYEVRQQSNTQ